MHTRETTYHAPRLILGLSIVLIGAVFLLNNLDVVDAHSILRYWPALLMILGLSYIAQSCSAGGRIWGSVLAFVGAGLLLERLDYISFDIWDFWPVILVIAGGSIVWQALMRRQAVASSLSEDADSTVRAVAVMAGFQRSNASSDFRGGELTAVMGGLEIDLRSASIKAGEAVIEVFAFWGGIELKVPDDWTVVVKATPFMGGFDDKTRPPQHDTGKRLVITGTVIMGGVEIRN